MRSPSVRIQRERAPGTSSRRRAGRSSSPFPPSPFSPVSCGATAPSPSSASRRIASVAFGRRLASPGRKTRVTPRARRLIAPSSSSSMPLGTSSIGVFSQSPPPSASGSASTIVVSASSQLPTWRNSVSSNPARAARRMPSTLSRRSSRRPDASSRQARKACALQSTPTKLTAGERRWRRETSRMSCWWGARDDEGDRLAFPSARRQRIGAPFAGASAARPGARLERSGRAGTSEGRQPAGVGCRR